MKNVPGCLGDADLIGDTDEDFCIDPNAEIVYPAYLEYKGDNGNPPSAFPLQECQSGEFIRSFQHFALEIALAQK